MFFDTQKYKCNNCNAVFTKTFFETLHCNLLRCPKCGSYNIKNISTFDSATDIIVRKSESKKH